MNYHHIYHAGNFADVFKHVVLALLLKALHKKDTPFFYLDTHAGTGRYNLHSEEAQKTGEFREGILRLWQNAGQFPELADYFAAVRTVNPSGGAGDAPRFYPGSPSIARFFLRPQDRMVLLEQQLEECKQLQSEFADEGRATVQRQDGYASLKALLPPKERRGLVLLDPSYESAVEFEQVVKGLRTACERWESGVYAVWYPIKERPPIDRLHRSLRATGIRKMLLAEFCPNRVDSLLRLNGCGMVVINPPWQFDDSLRDLAPRLLDQLRQDPAAGRTSVSWLVSE